MQWKLVVTQRFRTARNRELSTGLLARPFAPLLTVLMNSLAPHCSLRSLCCGHSFAPLRSFVCLLAHSLSLELVGRCMIRCLETTWFCSTVRYRRRQSLSVLSDSIWLNSLALSATMGFPATFYTAAGRSELAHILCTRRSQCHAASQPCTGTTEILCAARCHAVPRFYSLWQMFRKFRFNFTPIHFEFHAEFHLFLCS